MAKRLNAKTKNVETEAKPNVTRETFLEHYNNCLHLRNELDEANGRYRAALKAAKGDGINQTQLVKCITLRKADRDAVRLNERDWRRYAAWLDMPIGSQGDLFEEDEAPKQGAADAAHADQRAEGRKAGLEGADRDRSNPYAENSPEWHAFSAGWRDGDDERKRIMKMGKGRNGHARGNPEDRPQA